MTDSYAAQMSCSEPSEGRRRLGAGDEPAPREPFGRLAAMERLKQLAVVVALLTTGVVIVSLFHGFQILINNPLALIGSIILAALMMFIFVKVALVPERRYTSWVRGITGPQQEELLEDMYSRLSRPVMACSITCVTEFSVISAEAPV
jgi:hypothetical protein